MPLITHSAEFLAKQARKRANEKARERAVIEAKEKETKVKEFLTEQTILQEIEKLRSQGIENLSPAEKQQLKDWYLAAQIHNIPILRLFPVRYMETLRQIVRKLRLNKKLSQEICKRDISDPEFFKETAEIMEILSHNIQHLTDYSELGVEQYKEKYNLNRKSKSAKNSALQEIRPLERKIAEFQETPEEFEKRVQQYIKSLTLNQNREESL